MSRTFRNVPHQFLAKKHTTKNFNELLFTFSRDYSGNKKQMLPLKQRYDRISFKKFIQWEFGLI